MRQEFAGHGASRGSALGRARVRLPHVLEVVEEHIPAKRVEREIARLRAAIATVRGEMVSLRERLHGALRTRSANSSTCTACCWTTPNCCTAWTN